MHREAGSPLARSALAVALDARSTPLLSVLDARARVELERTAHVRELAPATTLYAAGDPADCLLFVLRGRLELEARGRHVTHGKGELFGFEAVLSGAERMQSARALEPSVVAEIPAAWLGRALVRTGRGELWAREESRARKAVWREVLRRSPLGRELSERELSTLCDGAREERYAAGESLPAGAGAAERVVMVVKGLVELSTKAPGGRCAGGVGVRSGAAGHAVTGDALGLELQPGDDCESEAAIARGDVTVLVFPRALLGFLRDQHPGALQSALELQTARLDRQRRTLELARGRVTRHAFDELERLGNARSLLAIDLESCVRCGHCVWACADTHGTARWERRGDKVRLALRVSSGVAEERALLLPNACQHCRDPVCLGECPTAALGRDRSGAVLVREDLCTGCGACASACPWDAIRMQPRGAAGVPVETRSSVAQKCDLCHGLDEHACVTACPTGAVVRLEPARDIVEVRAVAAGGLDAPERARRRGSLLPWLLLSAFPPLIALARLGTSPVAERFRMETGIAAGASCLALVAHALFKRCIRLRTSVARLTRRNVAISMHALVRLHVALAVLALGAVLAHAGWGAGRGAAGALSLAFFVNVLLGGAGAAVYRVLPARLASLERKVGLPEDWPNEREELERRLFAQLSAQNDALKALAQSVLVPYLRSRWGALALAFAGRPLAAEEARLRDCIGALLGGRKSIRLDAAGELVATAVALRGLGARRILDALLRGWVVLHALLAMSLLVLLAVHCLAVSW